MSDLPICTPKSLPDDLKVSAAAQACAINPTNHPRADRLVRVVEMMAGQLPDWVLPPEHLALLTQKYWGTGGVRLTVSFMESVQQELKERILLHMNAWSKYCNAVFQLVTSGGKVRVSLRAGGYWSYVGTDILSIPANQQTMNLEGFTMSTPESEFVRVVRHETGHTLGFPHEHMRREIVNRIDPAKATAYFGRTQGWSAAMVRQQVLTPLEESSLLGTEHADVTSIMTYQLPGSITKDGQPIAGGLDIDAQDQAFAGKVYPLASGPVNPPVNPPPTKWPTVSISGPLDAGTYTLTRV